MTLIENWRAELNRLWSIRAALFVALLSVADQVLAAFQMYMPPWVYAISMGFVMASRLIEQSKKAPVAAAA